MTTGTSPPSRQQLAFIQDLSCGKTYSQIGQAQGFSASAVGRNVREATVRMRVRNTTQLVAICVHLGWVDPLFSLDKEPYENLVLKHEEVTIPWMVKLSRQERKITGLVGKDLTNREIAQELSIEPNTVRVHLRNIYRKLQIIGQPEQKRFELSDAVQRSVTEREANNDH